jgi:hypothetical protein
MTIRRMIPLALLCALATAPALARPPESRLALLRAGISITNWFRFPPHADVTSLRAYLSNPALLDLRDAGFTVVRLPVQPELLWQDGMIEPGRLQAVALAVHRLQTARLAVWSICSRPPGTWRPRRPTGCGWSRPGSCWRAHWLGWTRPRCSPRC